MRSVIIFLLMMGAAWATVELKPAHKAETGERVSLETMLPQRFGAWRVDPDIVQIPPSPDVQANLNKIYSQMLGRTYVNDRGERIMLTVTYGGEQTDNLKAHRQEVCYAAQGFRISGLVHGTLAFGREAIPVTRLVASKDGRVEPITYWFTMGNRVVLSHLERLVVQLKYGLAGEIPDGMLVRVSSLSSDAAAAYRAQGDFVHELVGAMRTHDAARLIGIGAN